jgi:hypothetical protein
MKNLLEKYADSNYADSNAQKYFYVKKNFNKVWNAIR